MIRIVPLAMLLALTVLPFSVHAQTIYGLQPGDRIGVLVPSESDETAVGRLDAIDANGMRLTLEDGSQVSFARNDVSRLFVSTGMRSHTFKGLA